MSEKDWVPSRKKKEGGNFTPRKVLVGRKKSQIDAVLGKRGGNQNGHRQKVQKGKIPQGLVIRLREGGGHNRLPEKTRNELGDQVRGRGEGPAQGVMQQLYKSEEEKEFEAEGVKSEMGAESYLLPKEPQEGSRKKKR